IISARGERTGRITRSGELFSLTVEIHQSGHHTMTIDLRGIEAAIYVEVILSMELALIVKRPFLGKVSSCIIVYPCSMRLARLEVSLFVQFSVHVKVFPRAGSFTILVVAFRLNDAVSVVLDIRALKFSALVNGL